MAKLSGELIAYPLPNHPGWWAYRELSDGALLLVQLNKVEWFQLHEKHHQKAVDKIRDLDKHPLNQAARTVLERAREHPLPDEISLISLGRFAFNNEEVPDLNSALMALDEWTFGPGTMQKAIWVLEEAEVTPEDLLSRSLISAAQLVLKRLVE